MRSRAQYLASLLTIVFLVLLVAATLATRGTKASPDTIYVSTDGICGEHIPCYINIQDGLNAANPFDEIRAAMGIYTDTAGTVVTINKTVTLLGGWDNNFTTRDPSIYPTILDAQRNGRVVYITGYISPTIDGFVITGGDATDEADYARQGGGIFDRLADSIIQNNVITNNIASTVTDTTGFGGGFYLSSASAVISGNQILSNTASTGYLGYGGGLYLNVSSATVSRNTISDNTASTTAGGAGGGLFLYNGKATIESNRIISNTAYSGDGLYVAVSSPFTLTNNIIAQNGDLGLETWGSFTNPASGTLTNNTIAQNNLKGVLATGATTLTLTNNIVVSHTYGIWASGGATVTADYTLLYDNTNDTNATSGGIITSTNEVSGAPLFVDPSAWDYHIQVGSAAIDAGTAVPWLTTDIDGNPRPLGTLYDIGADETPIWYIYLPLILKNY